MDGENNEKPYFLMDDFGGFSHIFGSTPKWIMVSPNFDGTKFERFPISNLPPGSKSSSKWGAGKTLEMLGSLVTPRDISGNPCNSLAILYPTLLKNNYVR